MREEQNSQETKAIAGQRFDSPLYVIGGVTGEPERYLAEIPYELSKYEFSILKKGRFKSDAWFPIAVAATAGFLLAIIGKTLNALIQRQTPFLENWEIWSVVAGIFLSIILKLILRKKSPDEQEFDEIKNYIDQHYNKSPRRRIHVTPQKENQL